MLCKYRQIGRAVKCIFLFLISSICLSSCGDDGTKTIDLVYDPNTVPTMSTDSITMYISSDTLGFVQYKVLTKKWDVFDKAEDPYWFFPDKVYAEQYDSLGVVVMTIRADSVWRFTNRSLWELRGNVFATNDKGATYESQELFFDEISERFYSHVAVDIDDPEQGRLIALEGFNADRQMRDYGAARVVNAKVLVRENELEGGGFEIATDSVPPVPSQSPM